MVALAFEDPYLASLYDQLCADRNDQDFYLHLMMSEHAVLDVGCGTGSLLGRARAAGHQGRLVGLDPADAMLARARRNHGIEFHEGTLLGAGFEAEFDLIMMTGHAFHELRTDEDIDAFLAAARRALKPNGRLAFEALNPLVRPWQEWSRDNVTRITDENGADVGVWFEVEEVDGEYVTFTETYASAERTSVSRGTLRFVHAERLDALLAATGLVIHERYGNWDRSPFTPLSPEIITIAG